MANKSWLGGGPIDLSKNNLETRLTAFVRDILEREIENQKPRIESIKKWHKLYKQKRDKKNFPFEGAANICSPITRSDVDAIFVRIYDAITDKRRYFLFSPVDKALPEPERENIRRLEEAFDNFLKKELRFKEKIRDPLLQAIKIGTGIVKIVYEDVKKPFYRYYTGESSEAGETPIVGEERTLYSGPNIYPIPRERFVISSDAISIDEALLVGWQFFLTKAEVENRVRRGIFDGEKIKKIIPQEKYDEVAEYRGEMAGKELKPAEVMKPYEFWEIYTRFDVNDDGEEEEIMLVYNRQSNLIVRAIYNPLFYQIRPLCELKINNLEYQFDGEGVCEILEGLQDEIDALHNLRLDRLAQINLPIILYRLHSMPRGWKFRPGEAIGVDDPSLEDIMKVIQLPEVYNGLIAEEALLTSYADRAVGITPNVLGTSTSERPVAKETLIMLEEANKKFKIATQTFRAYLEGLAYKLLAFMAQFKPTYRYIDENGIEQEVVIPPVDLRSLLNIQLNISTEQMSMEIRREIALAKYQLISNYMTGLTGMAQMLTAPQVPPAFKKVLLRLSSVGAKLVKDVLEDFEDVNPENYVVDLNEEIPPEEIGPQMSVPPVVPPVVPPEVQPGGQGMIPGGFNV